MRHYKVTFWQGRIGTSVAVTLHHASGNDAVCEERVVRQARQLAKANRYIVPPNDVEVEEVVT